MYCLQILIKNKLSMMDNVYLIFACSKDQRDLNPHQQRGLLSLLQSLAGENIPGRGTSLPAGGSGPLLAPVREAFI